MKLYQEVRSIFDEHELGAEFSQQIHRIIQEMIDQIPDEARIVIRPAGKDTKNLLNLFDFSRKNIVGIVSSSNRGDDFYGYPCFTTDSFSTELCDCIIICSFNYRQEIKEEIETLHIPYIDIYDELEKRRVQLHGPFHFYESHTHAIVNYFYLRYLCSETVPQRITALRDLLQIAVERKDFTLISNIYQACGGENGEFPLLKTVWKKSERLLSRIQDKLQERKQKDIIMFWTDAIPYCMLHCLPGTMELSKQGTFFQRAYTTTPYTNSVMRAMFRNMLPIDDFPQNQEKIDSGNSSLVKFMEHEGYKVRFVGDSKRAMGGGHLVAVKEEKSCNIKWWEGIMDILQSPEPCFYIFHFMESHPPCYVPELEEFISLDVATRTQTETQIKAAFRYLDQCVLLYHKLCGNKIQIFFSDHGTAELTGKSWQDLPLHPYCFVVGENIPKITVKRFFSYLHFDKFIQWLTDPVRFSLDDACSDEIIFQDTDYYNRKLINKILRVNNPKLGISYRGILNYEYKYVINALGEEYFYQIQPDGSEKLIPLEDSALREKLQEKSGTKFLDINRYDKFIHTKRLYDYINQMEKNGNAI